MTYHQYYRMSCDPFPLIPETNVFFESNTHVKAIEFIVNCIKGNDLFVLVIGDYGTGKTLLCLKLLEVLKAEEGIKSVIYAPTPHFSYHSILRMIAKSISLDYEKEASIERLQELLHEYFQLPENQEGRIVILLDDFQEHTISSIEHIKWLGSYNSNNGFFPFRLVFFGHPVVVEKINNILLGSLSQKIRKRFYINAFDELETKEYIYFRLLLSGAKGYPYFQDDTVLEIHRLTGGIPRLINTICDACLVVGAREEKKVIDRSVLKKALSLTWQLGMASSEVAIGKEERQEPLPPPPPKEKLPEEVPAVTRPIPAEEAGLDFTQGAVQVSANSKGELSDAKNLPRITVLNVLRLTFYGLSAILIILAIIWILIQIWPKISNPIKGLSDNRGTVVPYASRAVPSPNALLDSIVKHNPKKDTQHSLEKGAYYDLSDSAAEALTPEGAGKDHLKPVGKDLESIDGLAPRPSVQSSKHRKEPQYDNLSKNVHE